MAGRCSGPSVLLALPGAFEPPTLSGNRHGSVLPLRCQRIQAPLPAQHGAPPPPQPTATLHQQQQHNAALALAMVAVAGTAGHPGGDQRQMAPPQANAMGTPVFPDSYRRSLTKSGSQPQGVLQGEGQQATAVMSAAAAACAAAAAVSSLAAPAHGSLQAAAPPHRHFGAQSPTARQPPGATPVGTGQLQQPQQQQQHAPYGSHQPQKNNPQRSPLHRPPLQPIPLPQQTPQLQQTPMRSPQRQDHRSPILQEDPHLAVRWGGYVPPSMQPTQPPPQAAQMPLEEQAPPRWSCSPAPALGTKVLQPMDELVGVKGEAPQPYYTGRPSPPRPYAEFREMQPIEAAAPGTSLLAPAAVTPAAGGAMPSRCSAHILHHLEPSAQPTQPAFMEVPAPMPPMAAAVAPPPQVAAASAQAQPHVVGPPAPAVDDYPDDYDCTEGCAEETRDLQLHPVERVAYADLTFVEHLGSGEFGQVCRGEYRGQEVAIKQLFWDDTLLPEIVLKDLAKEIESFRHLRHKRLVRFVGAVLEMPHPCLVTEYMPGGSLHHLLHVRRIQLPLLHAANMCLQLAEGVVYLHSQNPVVVHRDLKSQNVVLDLRLNLKLCDFGLTESMERTHITKRNNGGSPRYMAPELFDAKTKITEKVDIWAMGCIFAEIFGGPLPYEGINTLADLTRELLVHKRPPGTPQELPDALKVVIRGCHNFDHRLRPSSKSVFDQLREGKKRLRMLGML